jgi:hypothetical protein
MKRGGPLLLLLLLAVGCEDNGPTGPDATPTPAATATETPPPTETPTPTATPTPTPDPTFECYWTWPNCPGVTP